MKWGEYVTKYWICSDFSRHCSHGQCALLEYGGTYMKLLMLHFWYAIAHESSSLIALILI